MNRRGFTLVELLVVIAIITILSTLATLGWNRMSTKAAVEGQIKAVHADMMALRLEALYGKRERRIEFSGKTFKIYSSNIVTTSPLISRDFKFGFIGESDFVFNTSGMASGFEGSVCVDKASDAYVDSLVVTDGRINLGKKTGASCASADITKR
jgi:type IV fimbrial biogenesis protein FimT